LALLVVIFGVALLDIRAAWLIVFILIGFAGASAIQFHERHFYYLQFLPWWSFAWLAQAGSSRQAIVQNLTSPRVKRAIRFALTIVAAVGLSIVLSRLYQQRSAERLFALYEGAPRARLHLSRQDPSPGRTLFADPEWFQPLPQGDRITTRFLAVQFRDEECDSRTLPLIIRYQAALPELDFSEAVLVRLEQGRPTATTLYFAAYDRPDDSSRFRGIEVAADQARCIGEVSRVDALAQTPLLLTTVLGADWRHEVLYQRLR
jgi:hypothetical protein